VIEGSFENDDENFEDFEEIYDSDNDNILSDLDLMI
jgi:hypothetical protein